MVAKNWFLKTYLIAIHKPHGTKNICPPDWKAFNPAPPSICEEVPPLKEKGFNKQNKTQKKKLFRIRFILKHFIIMVISITWRGQIEPLIMKSMRISQLKLDTQTKFHYKVWSSRGPTNLNKYNLISGDEKTEKSLTYKFLKESLKPSLDPVSKHLKIRQ